MQVNDVLRDDTRLTVRVLVPGDLACWVVDCNRCRMPFKLDNGVLAAMVPVDESEYHEFHTDEELDTRRKEIRDNRFTLIQPLVAPEYVVDKAERNGIINSISLDHDISAKTIKTYLWRYWVAQSPNALLPVVLPPSVVPGAKLVKIC